MYVPVQFRPTKADPEVCFWKLFSGYLTYTAVYMDTILTKFGF
jgi:hypothetical protein